jgi:hypothetical protein
MVTREEWRLMPIYGEKVINGVKGAAKIFKAREASREDVRPTVKSVLAKSGTSKMTKISVKPSKFSSFRDIKGSFPRAARG